MGKIKRYKNAVERFISSEGGQRFFNFAYSLGAAVVILGALFKILHLPGGNTLLSVGMGTEVLMFILTAFDRPPREYEWESVFPVLDSHNPEDRPAFSVKDTAPDTVAAPHGHEFVTDPSPVVAGAAVSVPEGLPDTVNSIAEQMARLEDSIKALNSVSRSLLDGCSAITDNSDGLTSSSAGYVEQMQALNRNIAGLNTIYEIQLKSVSSQLDAIDRVNKGIKDISRMYEHSALQSSRYCEESEKMTQYMQQLNQVYEKMLRAMTVNMGGAAPSMPGTPSVNTPSND